MIIVNRKIFTLSIYVWRMLFALLRWNSNVVYIWKTFVANDKEFKSGGLTLSPITKTAELYIFQLFFSHGVQSHSSNYIAGHYFYIYVFFWLWVIITNQSLLMKVNYYIIIIFFDWNVCREVKRPFWTDWIFAWRYFRDAFSFSTFGIPLSQQQRVSKNIFFCIFFRRIICLTKFWTDFRLKIKLKPIFIIAKTIEIDVWV